MAKSITIPSEIAQHFAENPHVSVDALKEFYQQLTKNQKWRRIKNADKPRFTKETGDVLVAIAPDQEFAVNIVVIDTQLYVDMFYHPIEIAGQRYDVTDIMTTRAMPEVIVLLDKLNEVLSNNGVNGLVDLAEDLQSQNAMIG